MAARPQPTLAARAKQKAVIWKNKIKYFIPRMKAKYKSYKKNKAIDKELATPFADNMKQVVWQNYLRYDEQQQKSSYKLDRSSVQTQRFQKRVVRKVVDGLGILQPVVGIQPMQGPVGLVYLIEYKEQPSVSEDNMVKLSLQVVSNAVEAGSRKLQATWSLETSQDLFSLHGIDIEDELVIALSQEIIYEITTEILHDLARLNPTQEINIENFDTLPVILNRAANEIAHATKRGCGNVIVATPFIISMLQSIPSSVFVRARTEDRKYDGNLTYEGILNGTIKVYSSLCLPPDTTCLVLYKGGNGETDTGYIYCPYIPVMFSGIVIDPSTFQPLHTIMTRYGKHLKRHATIGDGPMYYKSLNINYDPDSRFKDVETSSPVKAKRGRKKVSEQKLESSLPKIVDKKEPAKKKATVKKTDKPKTAPTRKIQQPAKAGSISKKEIEKAVKKVTEQRTKKGK